MMLCFVYFFFSSRRRHTRCALVTGVQTCALPISIDGRRFPWGARHIPEPLVRLIARIPEDHALYLAKTDMPDEEVEAGTAIDLDAPGLERQIGRASCRERVCQYV